LLGGWLAAIPVAMVALFLISGFILTPLLRRRVRAASSARSRRHAFLVEALTRMHDVKLLGAEGIWFERFRTLSADAAVKDLHAKTLSSLLQTSAHVIMTAAGIATLALGAVLVINGDMTNGALIASIALVWRVLSVSGRLTGLSANSVTDDNGVVFYTADIRLDRNYVGDDPNDRRMLPGMSIQADVITGSKSVLRYLLKPIYASLGSAFSER